jgi:hypothetical protein
MFLINKLTIWSNRTGSPVAVLHHESECNLICWTFLRLNNGQGFMTVFRNRRTLPAHMTLRSRVSGHRQPNRPLVTIFRYIQNLCLFSPLVRTSYYTNAGSIASGQIKMLLHFSLETFPPVGPRFSPPSPLFSSSLQPFPFSRKLVLDAVISASNLLECPSFCPSAFIYLPQC